MVSTRDCLSRAQQRARQVTAAAVVAAIAVIATVTAVELESLRALPFERTHATEVVAAWVPCLCGQLRRTAAAKDVVRQHALKCGSIALSPLLLP